jgi:asparagine synthase (glutamine-hydrolysing)
MISIDLCATTRSAAQRSVDVRITRKHFTEIRRPDVYMCVCGDEPVDHCVFDGPSLSVICRGDFLPSINNRVAEHIAGLYVDLGDQFVTRLRGSFAIIIYDHRLNTLKAWTDHFAAEKLVFTHNDGYLNIATDLTLLQTLSGRQNVIDPIAVLEYLQYSCIPSPRTIYQNVSKLAAGHQLVSRPQVTTRAYWDMKYEERQSHRSEEAWAADTRDQVRAAVNLCLQGLDNAEKLGCFLSGGTDSSSVAGFVGQISGKSPRTFSIGFDDSRYNEIEYARIAAMHFGADHHEYFVKPDDIISLVQKAVPIFDEPFGNSSIVPTYYCARLAAENGVTHLLAGDGGDELFGGNARYADDAVFQHYSSLPAALRFLIEPVVSTTARWMSFPALQKAVSYVRRSNIPVPDRYFSYSLISNQRRDELFSSDFIAAVKTHDPLEPARAHFLGAPARSALNRWLYLDLKITISDNDIRKVTSMSRLAGVETRYPLLNPDLAEFSGRIPTNLKVKRSRLRYLFKKAMRDLLPPEIIKKSKHGFGLPYSVWLGAHKRLHDFTFDVLSSARCRQRGYLRPGLLNCLWSQYESVHRGYYGEIIWTWLMLELWHVMHADRRLDAPQRPPAASLAR